MLFVFCIVVTTKQVALYTFTHSNLGKKDGKMHTLVEYSGEVHVIYLPLKMWYGRHPIIDICATAFAKHEFRYPLRNNESQSMDAIPPWMQKKRSLL